jgi:hypothetical protein
MAGDVKHFHIHTVGNFAQLSYEDQANMVEMLKSLTNTMGDFRILSYVTPLSMQFWRDERTKVAQQVANVPWRLNGYLEELRLGDRIAETVELSSIQHYLMVDKWKGGADELGGWGLQAREEIPPPALMGKYAAHLNYLTPVDAQGKYDQRRPYARIIGSASLKDTWSWLYPLSGILREAEGTMVMAIDAKHVPQRQVEFYANTLQGAVDDVSRISDRGTLVKFQDAALLLTAMTQGYQIHNLRLFFMVLDSNKERLNKRVGQLATRLSPHMKVEYFMGYQGDAADVFSPTLALGGLPDNAHNVLSTGSGILMGVTGFFTREKYKGIYLGLSRGIDGDTLGLEYFDPWDGRKAAHKLILGETGFGKTVFMNALMAREAEAGAQVISVEPQGHSKRLRSYFGKENTAYNEVNYASVTYNPLDVVFAELPDQIDYFLILLEMLLNPRDDDSERPKRWLSNAEVASVQEALLSLYGGYNYNDLYEGLHSPPLLEDFVYWLKMSRGGDDLADEIKRMYVEGAWGAIFNRETNLNVRLSKPDGTLWPCVIYNLHGIPQSRRNLFYFIILAALGRESRKKLPDGVERPRRSIYIDEFRYLSSGSNMLVNWVADQIATARTYKVSYSLADQNPVTFMGVGGGGMNVSVDANDLAGRLHMLENMSYLFAFRLKQTGAERLQGLFPQLTNSHISWLARSATMGQTLFLEGNNISLVDVILRGSEIEHFVGS